MVTQTTVTVTSQEELLHELLENAEPFDKRDFARLPSGIYVHNQAWRSKRPIVLKTDTDDINYVREDRNNAIVNLHRIQQETFHRELSDKVGVELTHGTFKHIVEAAYSDEGAKFKKDVLIPLWVYALELIGPDGVYHTIRNPRPPEYQLVSDGRLLIPAPQHPAGIPYMNLSDDPIQTEVPTKTGHFNQVKSAIPVNNELKGDKGEDGRGYWDGSHPDKYGWSAVRCVWDSGLRGLYAIAVRPLFRCDSGALGTFAKAL